MQRVNNIYPRIYAPSNIEIADDKARKCKRTRYGVRKHDETREQDNLKLSAAIRDGQYRTSEYTTYKIYEPKERLIFRLPYYPDRITHHAIMNIMESIWTKIFTRDTYSCIKGRGIHSLAKKLKGDLKLDPKGTTYCLKMDITKFYPSIDHDILKSIIRKKIKDTDMLKMLDEIIDSADGVPIGNYLSQFFANLYMAYFDHWVKEELKVKYYYRYADDIVILSDSKDQLRNWLLAIKVYLSSMLKLRLKNNYLIFPVESRGIDFVGYVFRHNYTLLRKSIKARIFKLIKSYSAGRISRSTLQLKLASYFGWLKYCDSKHLLTKIEKLTGVHYSNWNGVETRITKFYHKSISLVNVEQKSKYFLLQFIYKGKPYQVKSSNKQLFMYLDSLPEYPIEIKIEQCLHQHDYNPQLSQKHLSH